MATECEQSVTIAQDAFCFTDEAPGVVEIHGLLTLKPNAAFDAAEWGTAKLWVQNDVVLGDNALLASAAAGPMVVAVVEPALPHPARPRWIARPTISTARSSETAPVA